MFQFVYFGILLADYSHPFLGPIQGWDYINGYNDLVMREDPTQQTLVDNTFKVYSYYHHFLDNCNVMIFLNLSLYVIALIVLLLSLLAEKPTAKKFTEGSKFFVIEIGFALMVFSLNNWIVGLAMEIYSGAIGDFSFLWSKVFGIIACIIIIVHISIFFFNVHILTDSSLYYKKHKEYTHFFPVIFILRNVLLITSVVLRPVLMKDAVIMTLCVQGVYVLVVLIGRPYRKPIDWVRGFLVEVTLFGFIGARFVEAQYI